MIFYEYADFCRHCIFHHHLVSLNGILQSFFLLYIFWTTTVCTYGMAPEKMSCINPFPVVNLKLTTLLLCGRTSITFTINHNKNHGNIIILGISLELPEIILCRNFEQCIYEFYAVQTKIFSCNSWKIKGFPFPGSYFINQSPLCKGYIIFDHPWC